MGLLRIAKVERSGRFCLAPDRSVPPVASAKIKKKEIPIQKAGIGIRI